MLKQILSIFYRNNSNEIVACSPWTPKLKSHSETWLELAKCVNFEIAASPVFWPVHNFLSKGGKRKTNDKNVKRVQEKEVEDDEDNRGNDSYLKERDEAPSTSKHLQKKAKKLAKKQAKVCSRVGKKV